MKQTQQAGTDSVNRVRNFGTEHASELGDIMSLDSWKALDAAATAILASTTDQGTKDRLIAGKSSAQEALVKDLARNRMKPIRLFARAKLSGTPDFAALTAPAKSNSVNVVVRAARSMADAAAKYVPQLVAGGFAPDESQQMHNLADQVVATKADRQNLRTGRIKATKQIDVNLAIGREAVRALNAVIVKKFAGNSAFLAAWRNASRVEVRGSTTPVPVAVPAVVSPKPVTATAPAPTPVSVTPVAVAPVPVTTPPVAIAPATVSTAPVAVAPATPKVA